MDKVVQDRTLNIGLDPGYGAFKAACIGADGPQVAVVPSVVGVGETDLGLLSVGNLGRRRSRRPDQVSFDAGGVRTYLVGENVARYARPVERMDFLRLSDGPELRALFYDAVFRLLGEGAYQARLMIGLPVGVMADREQARATLRALRSWLVAQHDYAVAGHGVRLDITDIRVMAQPAGTYFAWGLSDQGKWQRSEADLKAPVAVCDIGTNTLDLLGIQGGEVIGRFTGGDTVGMRRAAEMLLDGVRSSYGVGLSLHEADALLQQRQPRLYTSQGEQDLRPHVDQALDTTAAAVVSFVERHWGNGRQFAQLVGVPVSIGRCCAAKLCPLH